MSITEIIVDIPAGHIKNVFGQFDALQKNRKVLSVTIISGMTELKLGNRESDQGKSVFCSLSVCLKKVR